MKSKRVPVRSCVGCKELKNKKELIRVLKTPEGDVVVDGTGKKNGRGAYICPSVECLGLAQKTKALSRALNTSIPDEVYENIERQMLEFETR